MGRWLQTEMVRSPEDGHPSQYQPTHSAAAGIELTTIESQVRRVTTIPSHDRQRSIDRRKVTAFTCAFRGRQLNKIYILSLPLN